MEGLIVERKITLNEQISLIGKEGDKLSHTGFKISDYLLDPFLNHSVIFDDQIWGGEELFPDWQEEAEFRGKFIKVGVVDGVTLDYNVRLKKIADMNDRILPGYSIGRKS